MKMNAKEEKVAKVIREKFGAVRVYHFFEEWYDAKEVEEIICDNELKYMDRDGVEYYSEDGEKIKDGDVDWDNANDLYLIECINSPYLYDDTNGRVYEAYFITCVDKGVIYPDNLFVK